MEIIKGIQQRPVKAVIYGVEGVGKSTFASKFPDPLFIDTEGSTSQLDVNRFEAPTSWEMIKKQVDYVANNPGICQTLVIDTFDWAEQICIADFCKSKQINGIEDLSYGKGYTYIAEEIGRFLNYLSSVSLKLNLNIVLLCHSQIVKFEQPDEMGVYDRYELKISKKAKSLIKEWCDLMIFANFKTMVVNVDGKGATKGKNKAQGSLRMMYCTHQACWDAKNRFGLADELPFNYELIDKYIYRNEQISPMKTEIAKGEQLNQQSENVSESLKESIVESVNQSIPDELADLMKIDNISEEQLQAEVGKQGYFPPNMPVSEYPHDFIGFIVSNWQFIKQAINK